jgi:hypothetical protein
MVEIPTLLLVMPGKFKRSERTTEGCMLAFKLSKYTLAAIKSLTRRSHM